MIFRLIDGVLLIGGLPRPSGGVTVFLGRLVNRIGGKVGFHVLDIHAGEKEPTRALSHRIAPANRLLRHAWIIWNVCITRCRIVHFNYSSGMSLLLVGMLPKLGRRFFVTLHNGTQPDLRARSRLLRWAFSVSAARIDRVFSLCEHHEEFYESIGIPASRRLSIKSQIPAVDVQPACVDAAHVALRAAKKHMVVSSGHVERSYNFEYLIRYVNEHPDTGGLFFFYGAHPDNDYLDELRKLIIDPDSVLFYFHQTERTFLAALGTSDAYLRPTYVDSWGIAVADAVSMGIPAIASNVCERYPGAVLCAPDDYPRFASLTEQALEDIHSSGRDGIDYSSVILDQYLRLGGGLPEMRVEVR